MDAYLPVSHKYFEKDTDCYYRGNANLTGVFKALVNRVDSGRFPLACT